MSLSIMKTMKARLSRHPGSALRRVLQRSRAALMLLALLAGGAAHAQVVPAKIALLVPDGTIFQPNTGDLTRPVAYAWLDAIREQGMEANVVTVSTFMRNGSSNAQLYRGVILPDTIHQRMEQATVDAVYQYVGLGGRLLLTYDAGSLSPCLSGQWCFETTRSRFSGLAGVSYALNDRYPYLVGLGAVLGAASTFRSLHVPPGKSVPFTLELAQMSVDGCALPDAQQVLSASATDAGAMAGHNHEIFHQAKLKNPKSGATRDTTERRLKKARKGPPSAPATPLSIPAAAGAPAYDSIVGYGYGALCYPSFVTTGAYDGTTLLGTPDHGVQAGLRNHGAGRVLFVNLPLGYLKTRDDGMLLHGFVDYFARNVAGVPKLTSVPDGVAGLIFNWHLDSGLAQQPTLDLKKQGVWNHGPFSMHMTAGPDTIDFGDGIGWNLPVNKVAQDLLREFARQGHQVGSHGGWIHDYYGKNASDANPHTDGCRDAAGVPQGFEYCLVLNNRAVIDASRVRPTEYSAPEGNNPIWSLQWYKDNGIEAYYSLSHTGMGPTKTWRLATSVQPNVSMFRPDLWVIPLTTYGMSASFEEWQEGNFSKDEIKRWFADLMRFVQDRSTVRQIYAHPPGASEWPDVLKDWLTRAAAAQRDGLFRWYTMTDMARFMARREAVQWDVSLTGAGATRVAAGAKGSKVDLTGMTWSLPTASFQKPVVTAGSGAVSERGGDWLVRAKSGTRLEFEAGPR